MRALILLDTLWWLGEHDGRRQPRTGISTLVRAMAGPCGWPTKNRGDRELVDAHAGTVRRLRLHLAAAGLLTWTVAQDDELQDRATDWTLRVPEVDAAALAAADDVSERYRARHDDLAGARPRSARVLGERLRRHKHRCALRLSASIYNQKFQCAPLPSGRAYGPSGPKSSLLSESSYRAPEGASNHEVVTRRGACTVPTTSPRVSQHGVVSTEEGGKPVSPEVPASSSSRAVHRSRRPDAQELHDVQLGWVVAHKIDALGGLVWPLSARAAARLGRLARLTKRRVGLDVDQVARALHSIQVGGRSEPLTLAEAAARLRWDLRHHPATPGAEQRGRRRATADARRARKLEVVPPPSWVRSDHHGRVLAVGGSGGETSWIVCAILPADLDSPAVRLAVHAAAHHAGISPTRRAAATSRGESERVARGDGAVRLIALDGSCAIVPREDSDAPTTRWKLDTATTAGQREAWKALRARHGGGLGTAELPDQFAAAWRVIADALAAAHPEQQTSRHRPPATPAARSAESAQVRLGRELIARHGSRAAALLATHPDRGGNPEELMAVLAVPASEGER